MEKTHPPDDAFQFFYLICHYFWINFCKLPVLLINWKNLTWVYFSILVGFDKFDYENPTAESLIDRILLNPKKFAQDAPLKGLRIDYLYTIKKECFNDVTTDNNGAYLNSRSNKRVYTVGSFNDGKLQIIKIFDLTITLIFINLEMDIIMRLLTLMQREYIP